ncbi:hypothetical protein [Micromonospora endophytica]|uniref:Uncharacterized protein n=1 Tax=Micromonospora endophytica TaxID=515350 RepID=A0A2W2DV29_9ACTN|nr:hypothetical protein [Micromonospora endophytica]PZG01027.1 hypothetical protein C1I93_00620 [Micromonospora endophytica]RIW47931.1 hypothetical protein D3H59_08630 [Micromonospora endophytica]BCJ62307.1 hypothetical protein Jiend_57290 [Micromonospora endophytica]
MADTATTAVPSRRRILHAGSLGMIVGGLLALVGSLLPWVITPFGTLNGMAGPGLWTLSVAFLAIAGALLPHRKVAIAHSLIPGATVALIVGWQAARLISLSASTGSWGQLMPGIGMVMAAGGAVVLIRTGIRLLSLR